MMFTEVHSCKKGDLTFTSSQDYFQAMFFQSPIPIAVLSLEGGLLYANPSILKLFSCQNPFDLAALRTFCELIEGFDWNTLQSAQYSDFVWQDFPGEKSNGIHYRCILSALLNQDGCPFAASLYLNDITKEICLRQQCKQQLEKMQALLDNIPYPVFSYDNKEQRYDIYNRALADWHGLAEEDLRSYSFEDLIEPYIMEYYRIMGQKIEQSLHEPVVTYEGPLHDGHGQSRDVMVCKRFARDDNGKITNVAGIIIDMTEQKKLEQELATVDRLKVAGRIAAGVAHEIRNPITAVYGFAQLLREDPACKDYHQYFDWMLEELDLVKHCISEFLLLSVNSMMEPKPASLNSIVKDMAPLITAQALEQDANICFELSPYIPEIYVNNEEIRQMIWHMVKNGLEAMNSSGSLMIRTWQDQGEVVLEVQDSGCGIPEEHIPKLGLPFFTTKEGASGLGLAIAYSIAMRHNAVIEVKSRPGETSFQVHFKL